MLDHQSTNRATLGDVQKELILVNLGIQKSKELLR